MLNKTVTERKVFETRKDIFVQNIMPILGEKGFVKSPFKTACFGRTSNTNVLIYEMCRLRTNSLLEFVTTKISRRDRYIKVYINAFKLCPEIQSVLSLQEIDGTKFYMQPNNGREMWIDVDFITKPPLFSMDFWFHCLMLKKAYTAKGREERIEELRQTAMTKVNNIDTFFDKWYARHHPYFTNWNGEPAQTTSISTQ